MGRLMAITQQQSDAHDLYEAIAAQDGHTSDPKWAYRYVRRVLREPRLDLEPVIMRDPQVAVDYAWFVLKERWPEAEPIILQNPEAAYFYAMHVIRGRWPEAEVVLEGVEPWGGYYWQTVGMWP